MSNTYLTIAMITLEMIEVLHNNIVATKQVTRKYEDQFARAGAKIGAQIQIRKPPLYTVSNSVTFDAQPYQETSVPLVVDQHRQIGVEFINDDLTLSMDDFSNRVIRPAMVPMGNAVDTYILDTVMPMVWNATGTPGTIAATDTPYLDALTLLDNNAAPGDFRMLVNPTASARLSSGLAGRFNPTDAISKLYTTGSMDKGMMGTALGWYFFKTQNMPVYTTGNWAAADANGIQVNGADQTGTAVLLDNAATSVTALGRKNDVIQFEGVYMVNPVTYRNTGLLQNFVLTADCDSDGGGAVTVNFQPPIITSGKNQTVTNSPANNAVLSVWGVSTTGSLTGIANKVTPQMMGWDKQAITLACVDLEMPGNNEGVSAHRAADPDSGLSILFMRSFDPRQYSRISRMDMLFGCTATRPEHVARVASGGN